jgi:hypothetical protein
VESIGGGEFLSGMFILGGHVVLWWLSLLYQSFFYVNIKCANHDLEKKQRSSKRQHIDFGFD